MPSRTPPDILRNDKADNAERISETDLIQRKHHFHESNKLITSDWDPTKWIIYILHIYTPLVPTIARTPESSISKARARMHMAEADRLFGTVKADEMAKDPSQLPVWTKNEVVRKHGEWVGERRRVLLVLEGCVVDVGGYLEDHVRIFPSLPSFLLVPSLLRCLRHQNKHG
jgi:hypothetical protein